MCNDFEQHVKWALYQDVLAQLNLSPVSDEGPEDLPGADDIRIGELAAVVRAAGNGVEVAAMKFGFPAPRPKAPRVFNFISENRDFSHSQRCAVPASAFFEFTGVKYPKAKHRFTLKNEPFLFIAGLWREGPENSFTMLTTGPGPDIAPYHDRQIVVMPPADLPHWLFLTRPQADILHPLPRGSLNVETVRRGHEQVSPGAAA